MKHPFEGFISIHQLLTALRACGIRHTVVMGQPTSWVTIGKVDLAFDSLGLFYRSYPT